VDNPFLVAALVFFFVAAVVLGVVLRQCGKRRRQAEERCEMLVREKQLVLDFLHELGETNAGAMPVEELLRKILRSAMTTTHAAAGAVFVMDPDRRQLVAAAVEGLFPPPQAPPDPVTAQVASRPRYLEQMMKRMPVPLGRGLLGQVAAIAQPVLIRNGDADPRTPRLQGTDFPRVETMMAAPLRDRTEVFGVMAVVNTTTGQPFTFNDQSLFNSLVDQAALAYRSATLQALKAEQSRVERELQIAAEIQKILLPKTFPKTPGLDVAGINIPALKLGGDYFDFIPLDDRRLGVVIADVSGKGVPGGLTMAMCRTVLRPNAQRASSAAEVVSRVNQLLFPDLKEDMFITLTYLIVDARARAVEVARAGHDPMLVASAGGDVQVVESRGMAIGLDGGELFDSVLENKTLALKPGDTLLLYTDGITEAEDPSGAEFGRDRLCAALKDLSKSPAREIVDGVIERVKRFTGDVLAHDDVTLVAVKID
jgi:sigma-B regulation protein RsbU (phosphoserine phosphatase)